MYQIFLFLIASFFYVVANAAVPNYWKNDINRGFVHHNIISSHNQGLDITCNVAAGEDDDNRVYFSPNVRNDDNWVPLMGNEEYGLLVNNSTVLYIPSSTNFRLGASAWVEFVSEVENATDIKVYKNGKEVATFMPQNLKVIKGLSEHCTALMYRGF